MEGESVIMYYQLTITGGIYMKIIKLSMLAVLLTVLVIVLGGCTFSLNSFTAKAINIKADGTSYSAGSASLVGTTVYLYAYNSSTGTYSTTDYVYTTVGSNGTFTFDLVAGGKYKMTGSNSQWYFVPRYVELSNEYSTLPDLLGYPADDNSLYTIVATWENRSVDLDMSLTYGGSDLTTTTTYAWNTGYEAVPDASTRYRIYEDRVGDTSGIMMNRSVDPTLTSGYPLVETITIYSDAIDSATAPWFDTYGDTAKIYLDAPDSNELLTGDLVSSTIKYPAYAQIDIMREGVHFGTWYAPFNTLEDTLDVVEMEFDSVGGDDDFWIYSSINPVTDIKSVIWE